MSDLSNAEKHKLERLLKMKRGCVLNFSNETFQELIFNTMKINIYDDQYSFSSGSKANRLRAFWRIEDNYKVGKLLGILLSSLHTTRTLNKKILGIDEQTLFNECLMIAKRLKKDDSPESQEESVENKSKNNDFDSLKSNLLQEFDSFAGLLDKQKRGYLFENLLTRVFSLYKIQTHESFKRNHGGEQIDGAFKFESCYYLLECKWTQKLSDIRQLDSLYGKINRSGRQTLGLFLSVNGWSQNVCSLLKQNPDKSIILMDGYDLRCILDKRNRLSLMDLISKKLESLNIEGEPFYSVSRLLNNQ